MAADGVAQKVGRKVTIGSEPSLPSVVKAEAGVEATRDYERTRLFACGLGLGGSAPGWEFTRAPGRLLEGSCLLELVVQAGRGARLSVSGVVTAQTAGGLPFRFRAELPTPLAFSGDI